MPDEASIWDAAKSTACCCCCEWCEWDEDWIEEFDVGGTMAVGGGSNCWLVEADDDCDGERCSDGCRDCLK